MNKLKQIFLRVIHVSRLTNVSNKKSRILLSVFLANLAVGLDILIIIVFSYLLTDKIGYENKFVNDTVLIISKSFYILPLVVFFRFSCLFFERYNLELLNLDVQNNLKRYVMNEVYNLGNFSVADTYYFVNQVTSQISSFYKSFSLLLNSSIQVLTYAIFLMITDLSTFIYFLIGGLIIALPSSYLLKKSKEYQHITFNEGRALSGLFQRIIENVFLIKILSTFDIEAKRLNENLQRFKNSQKMNILFGSINSILPTFFTIFTLSILFSNFTVNSFVTLEFIAVLLRLFQSLGSVNTGIGLVVNSSVHVEELYKLDVNKPIIKKENYVIDKEIEIAVRLENVNFEYFNSSDIIFKNLNMEISKNSHTIITGPNGSGKSTILGLIAGLYLPTKGKISIFTDKIGYVGVTPLVFDGSIKENILYGNARLISDKEISDLLIEFNFYNEGKYNLNKPISNKTLSSGQLQKISFMRSILSESKILLLDEATSNLDSSSKKLIFDILSSRNITIINSTHNIDDFNYENHIEIYIENDLRKIRYH